MSTDNTKTIPPSIGWPPPAQVAENSPPPPHYPGWVISGKEPMPPPNDPSPIRNPKH